MPSIFATVKDYESVDAPVDAGAKGDEGAMETKDGNYKNLTYDKTKCHQVTQTEPFTSLRANVHICEYSLNKLSIDV